MMFNYHKISVIFSYIVESRQVEVVDSTRESENKNNKLFEVTIREIKCDERRKTDSILRRIYLTVNHNVNKTEPCRAGREYTANYYIFHRNPLLIVLITFSNISSQKVKKKHVSVKIITNYFKKNELIRIQ